MTECFSREQKTFLRISNKPAKISNKCFTSMQLNVMQLYYVTYCTTLWIKFSILEVIGFVLHEQGSMLACFEAHKVRCSYFKI